MYHNGKLFKIILNNLQNKLIDHEYFKLFECCLAAGNYEIFKILISKYSLKKMLRKEQRALFHLIKFSSVRTKERQQIMTHILNE